ASRALPDLPPFPTRRSSDLVVPLVVAQLFGLGGATWMSLGGFNGALADRGGPYRTRAATMGTGALCCAIAIAIGTLVSGHVALADRKSTRLNSSHDQISYAV